MFSFVFAQTGSTEVSFITSTGDFLCIKDFDSAYWQEIDTGKIIDIFNSTYSPSGMCDNYLYSLDWCCPENYECLDGECISLDLGYNGDVCTSLSDKNTCNTAPASFAISLMEKFQGGYTDLCGSGSSYEGYFNGSDLCSNVTTCSCAWGESVGDAGACGLNYSRTNICGDTSISLGSCSWFENPSAKQDLCSTEGNIIIVYDAAQTAGFNAEAGFCSKQEVKYPCSVSIQLPFFDKFSFIFSILAIVGIYFVMSRGRNVKQ